MQRPTLRSTVIFITTVCAKSTCSHVHISWVDRSWSRRPTRFSTRSTRCWNNSNAQPVLHCKLWFSGGLVVHPWSLSFSVTPCWQSRTGGRGRKISCNVSLHTTGIADSIICGIDVLVMSIVTRCNASFTVALSDRRIDHSEVLVQHGRVQE